MINKYIFADLEIKASFRKEKWVEQKVKIVGIYIFTTINNKTYQLTYG